MRGTALFHRPAFSEIFVCTVHFTSTTMHASVTLPVGGSQMLRTMVRYHR
jgi:hypothetical protein